MDSQSDHFKFTLLLATTPFRGRVSLDHNFGIQPFQAYYHHHLNQIHYNYNPAHCVETR